LKKPEKARLKPETSSHKSFRLRFGKNDERSLPWLWNRDWILWPILVVLTFVAYQPAWNGAPIWDDAGHMTKPELRSLRGLGHIWLHPGATQQYYPVVHSVFWLEYRLWGDATRGYHWINILLHLFSAFLLVKILKRLQIRGAWLAAGIFVLHPVQVESVAWISELKNTLSTIFLLGSTLAYLKFDSCRNRKYYAVAAGFFILGLMSKSVIAPLPVALLVVFWWKRGRVAWSRDVVPLLPFFLIGIASGLFTSWVEQRFVIGKDSPHDFELSIIERILIAGRAIWFYLGKLLWPVNLIFIYPRWNINKAALWQYFFPFAALMLAGSLWAVRRWSRAPLAGFLYFVAMLFPALGFFNVYPFRYSFVADHFQYLACMGPIVLAAAGMDRAAEYLSARKRQLKLAFCGILLVVLGMLTWNQSRMYVDADTVYKRTLQGNPACWMAHYNFGNDLLQQRHVNEAIDQFRNTIEIKPGYVLAHVNLGNALMQAGRTDEGIFQYRAALAIDSTFTSAYINLGNAYMEAGLAKNGMEQYRRALKFDPNLTVAHYDLGNTFMQTGQIQEGIAQYRIVLELDSNYTPAHVNIGRAFLQIGQVEEGIGHLRRALQIEPGNADAQGNLGFGLMQAGYPDEAIIHFKKALEANPRDFRCISALRDALLKTGQLDEAIHVVQRAIDTAKAAGDDSLAMGIAGDLRKLQALNNHRTDQ
jgi:tetratricopeptide (TPR) repeat protein